MAIDTTSPRTRRALLTAAVGGAAAAAAASVAKVNPVGAANGDNVILGQENQGTDSTRVTTPNATSLWGASTSGAGVLGTTQSDIGVFGTAQSLDGFAFGTYGRIRLFNICGVATIKKGKKSVTVKTGERVNDKTFVLLTPKANIGSRALWYTTNTSKNSITIRMSSTRGGPTKIAWLTMEWRKAPR